jgi:hypothetical protein
MRRPAKVARMLTLAHHLHSPIDRDLVTDRAAVARKLGLTRARVTHVLDLLLLDPEQAVLALEAVGGDGSADAPGRRPRRALDREAAGVDVYCRV